MRTYLLLKARAAAFRADPEVQAALSAARVDELAHAAHMSTARLERAMRRALAISPKQYILRIRAERAAVLLATTRRPIAQISAECGYYDQSQMTRQFRAHIGVTPKAYRQALVDRH